MLEKGRRPGFISCIFFSFDVITCGGETGEMPRAIYYSSSFSSVSFFLLHVAGLGGSFSISIFTEDMRKPSKGKKDGKGDLFFIRPLCTCSRSVATLEERG